VKTKTVLAIFAFYSGAVFATNYSGPEVDVRNAGLSEYARQHWRFRVDECNDGLHCKQPVCV
jgi:hypothetical protein